MIAIDKIVFLLFVTRTLKVNKAKAKNCNKWFIFLTKASYYNFCQITILFVIFSIGTEAGTCLAKELLMAML